MRHEELLSVDNCVLVAMDIQEALMAHIHERERVIERSRVMVEAAKLLELPIVVTEQYPKGLGHTVEAVAEALGDAGQVYEKVTFSGCRDEAINQALVGDGRQQVILMGVETHVCVAQTAYDLLAAGMKPYILIDAVSSRRPEDTQIALSRVIKAGAVGTTTEAAIMELIGTSKHGAFRDLLKAIK